jgi:hypothetical protein
MRPWLGELAAPPLNVFRSPRVPGPLEPKCGPIPCRARNKHDPCHHGPISARFRSGRFLAPFPGLTFHDNGNGTATISGSTSSGIGITSSGACQTVNGRTTCTGITAKSAQGTVTQPFGLGVPYPPEAQLEVSNATFITGIPNSFKVTTAGAITPIQFAFDSSGLSWLSLHDTGDGTAALSGTPPVGNSGQYTTYVYPYPKVSGGVISAAPLLFTLDVLGRPLFLSQNSASFTVGDASSFTISTNQLSGSITEIGALSQGLIFTDNGNGTASLSGTPAAGAGGFDPLLLSITGQTGTATQALNLQVNEAPSFATPPTIFVNFHEFHALAVSTRRRPTAKRRARFLPIGRLCWPL